MWWTVVMMEDAGVEWVVVTLRLTARDRCTGYEVRTTITW